MPVPNFVRIAGTEQSNDDYAEKWLCTGLFNGSAVKSNAYLLTAPAVTVDTGYLYRQDIRCQERGVGVWEVTVPYSKDTQVPGSVTFAFDTTGGSFHITHSKETRNKYGTTTVDYKQAINVVKDGGDMRVEGSDIVIPSLKLSYSIRQPQGVVDEEYARMIARLTGCTNSTEFRGFDPGEVLFLGGTGSDGTNAEAEVTLQFAAEQNLQDLMIGAISGIEKAGFDLLWVMWKDDEDGGKPTKSPLQVNVERVYEEQDLAGILGL